MGNEEILQAIAGLRTELLGRMDEQINGLRADMRADMKVMEERLIDHTNGVGAQLHTQIQQLDQRLCERFDRVEARLERQGGLVQAGGRAMARFIEWSETTDVSLPRFDRRLTDIEKRLFDIENRNGGRK